MIEGQDIPRLSVDFNTLDVTGRIVHVPTHVHPEYLEILKLGLRVIVFEEHDMEVDAVIEFEKEDYGWSHRWFAEPDWSTIRDWDEATQQYLPRTG